ncbi:NAD(P)-binding Rossmann-fold superfamily protein [Zea mays]|uniref:NAD(P)-binding Rossmann-fold superfamily protein n=1 Tax=Zea mays TaxID=4577 RepID=A0A1D6HPY3_MAIZE|nr:NAD(P)-binding Rossmann-fold superfamily protein [Zea mays]
MAGKEERKRVLVVGGSGYLGQHLLAASSTVDRLDVAFTHHSPAPPQPLLETLPSVRAFRADLRSGDGFEAISASFGQPHVVVNCAAMSVPRACELDPPAAMATNVPSSLVNWLLSFGNEDSLLIQLSTDQGTVLRHFFFICGACMYILDSYASPVLIVYEGVKSFYKEEDETMPVNMYGKSKVAAEKLIVEKCSNYAILRSSIIYGPQTISPVAKSLPIQWMDGVLSQGQQVEFFSDEFRCPVYVKDMVDVILSLTKTWFPDDGKKVQVLLNVGGPDRVSRLQMAESVAVVRGYNPSIIKSVSASSVNRGVASPPDISMDITKLTQILGIKPISFQDGVRSTLDAEDST